MLTQQASILIDRELVAKGSFFDFVGMAWQEVDPAPFLPNWHHEEVCAHLEAVSQCEIRNLIINEPPGCTKSLLVNVLWPAWEWIRNPKTKFIYGSFDSTLVGRRDGGKLINLLRSPWFKARWGDLLVGANPSANAFDTRAGGFRFATSPGGKGTGRHANIVAVDDPIKPRDAAGGGTIAKNALSRVSEWWANTMSTRQADPKTHRNVITMQRVHNGDLAGEMLRTGKYVHLCLPMRFTSSFKCQTQWGGDRRTEEGELLFPQRYPEEEVANLEESMGGPSSPVASAQLQQRPTVTGGGIFKRVDWRFWHKIEGTREPCLCEECFQLYLTVPGYRNEEHQKTIERTCTLLPAGGFDIQSWDMTFKKSNDSDFVGAGLWRAYLSRYFLLEILNERMGFTLSKAAVIRWSKMFPRAYTKLIEDKANGTGIEDELKIDIPGIVLVEPKGGKEARANAVTPLYAAQKVFLPHPDYCPGVWQFIAQHEAFPRDEHDDQVDQASQALLFLRQTGDNFAEAMREFKANHG